MQERTLKNLILKNGDYIFPGNLTITGNVFIENGNLIVSGTLTIIGDTTIKNGNISCGYIDAQNITIIGGDIFVNKDASFANIQSDGNIEVRGNSSSCTIYCLNYLVDGDNNSTFIYAIEDVYILGCNDSYDIKGRDVFVGGICDFNNYTLIAKAFECTGIIINCSSMKIC